MVALNKTYQKTLTPDRSAKDSGLRYYSPEISRWLNRDPITENGGLNLYGFVVNQPVTRIDALGLECKIHVLLGHGSWITKVLNAIVKAKIKIKDDYYMGVACEASIQAEKIKAKLGEDVALPGWPIKGLPEGEGEEKGKTDYTLMKSHLILSWIAIKPAMSTLCKLDCCDEITVFLHCQKSDITGTGKNMSEWIDAIQKLLSIPWANPCKTPETKFSCDKQDDWQSPWE